MTFPFEKKSTPPRGAWTLAAVLMLMAGFLAGQPSRAQASVTSINLDNYSLTGIHRLPRGSDKAREASAVTYNWDTDTLFVVGDEGDALVEVSKTGQEISVMSLSGFDDTEGLTYVGNGQFVITEERIQDAFLLDYAAGGSVDRSSLAWADLGSTVGNIGIEGISYNPSNSTFLTVKEKTPQQINVNTIDFSAGTAAVSSLFAADGLGVKDLSDIQILTTVGLDNNLLIFSQESALLMEVDMAGTLLSQFDFTGLSGSAEGVTIDRDGNIYVVSENGSAPLLYTLEANPVPVPGSVFLLGTALAGLAGLVRRRN